MSNKEWNGNGSRVVCAAMRLDGLVICSPRHWDSTAHALVRELGGDWKRAEQGFVDQRGNFLTREEAHDIAFTSGQIIRRCGGDEATLYSENLY